MGSTLSVGSLMAIRINTHKALGDIYEWEYKRLVFCGTRAHYEVFARAVTEKKSTRELAETMRSAFGVDLLSSVGRLRSMSLIAK